MWQWTWRETVKHQYFDLLALVGLRDRLRCPRCKAVGTWKPHGGWLDLLVEWWTNQHANLPLEAGPPAKTRRWVCKYCGYIRSCIGEQQGRPNRVKRVWDVHGPDSTPTPKEAVEQACGTVWPWRG
jgi:hypothetical protein